MIELSLPTQTLYAELTELVRARELARSVARLSGSFVSKTVRGKPYWYFKYSVPGGVQKELYLGVSSAALQRLMDNHRAGRSVEMLEEERIETLCDMLRAGHANLIDHGASRVLRALSDASVFQVGGVLVGTYAYVVIGNLLGVRWASGVRTQDIDIAAQADSLAVALPALESDVPSAIDSLSMGSLPVPALDPRHSSTSYKVRGRALRLDFITPAMGRRRASPILIQRLNVSAAPLEMLDYVMEKAIAAAAVNSTAVAVTVPDPARFALHKLAVAERRDITAHPKVVKDQHQALSILESLQLRRPGDITRAIKVARDRYASVYTRIARAIRRLPSSVVAETLRAQL